MTTKTVNGNGNHATTAMANMAVPPWLATLRAAVSEACTPEDLKAMIKTQVEKAKSGDARAVKLVFDLMGGNQKVQLTQHVHNYYSGGTGAGGAESTRKPSLRKNVLDLLKKNGPMASGQIAASLGADEEAVGDALDHSAFVRSPRGLWDLSDR